MLSYMDFMQETGRPLKRLHKDIILEAAASLKITPENDILANCVLNVYPDVAQAWKEQISVSRKLVLACVLAHTRMWREALRSMEELRAKDDSFGKLAFTARVWCNLAIRAVHEGEPDLAWSLLTHPTFPYQNYLRRDSCYYIRDRPISEFFQVWIKHCRAIRQDKGPAEAFRAMERLFQYLSNNLILVSADVEKDIHDYFKDGDYQCSTLTSKTK